MPAKGIKDELDLCVVVQQALPLRLYCKAMQHGSLLRKARHTTDFSSAGEIC